MDFTLIKTELFLIIDTESNRQKALNGQLQGVIVARATQANKHFMSSGQTTETQAMKELNASFKSVTFEQNVSKILLLLNSRLGELKSKNKGTYMNDLKTMLTKCKERLIQEIECAKNVEDTTEWKNKDAFLEKLHSTIKNTFDGVNQKTLIQIDLMQTVLKINETLKIMQSGQNCIVSDPWRYDSSKMRVDAITCRQLSSMQISNNFMLNEFMAEKINKILENFKNENGKPDVTVKRVGASQFQLEGKVDHNEEGEGKLIFTALLKQTRDNGKWTNFKKKGINDRAFKVYFRGEGSIDDGGPLRETYDFACNELQTSSLPVLIPTAN